MRTNDRTGSRHAVRTVAAALVAFSALGSLAVGCGSDEPSTRVVETSFGSVELPADPERVIALDEYAAMNLLALGIEPMEVTGSYASLVSQDILASRSVEIVEQGDAFTVNFEAIAAAEPDVIVVTAESAFMASVEPLMEIAPTVILPYTVPWRDVIADTGELFDRQREASQVIDGLETKIDDVAEVVDGDPFSLSILGDTFDIVFAVSPEAVLSDVVGEVGIERPAAQVDGPSMEGFESIIGVSTELLADHDADVVAVMDGVFYRSATLLDAPTYQALPAVEAGNSVIVDGDMWFGTHPFAIYWILEDLQHLAVGDRDAVGGLDDADRRWAAYQELIGEG